MLRVRVDIICRLIPHASYRRCFKLMRTSAHAIYGDAITRLRTPFRRQGATANEAVEVAAATAWCISGVITCAMIHPRMARATQSSHVSTDYSCRESQQTVQYQAAHSARVCFSSCAEVDSV